MSKTNPPPFDVVAYLARVGYEGPLEPTLEVLESLHLAHATHIPFENLDILLGHPIRLDLESLQAKLVRDRRGGYCFEHNTLFAAVLEQAGFTVTPLAARVRLGSTGAGPRTHMLLHVDVAGSPYLADVGFGGESLLKPLPFELGRETTQFGRVYRLFDEAGVHVLQTRRGEGWFDLYAFTMEPQLAIDYVVANHYTSTFPSSLFQQHVFVQRTTPDASYLLFDRKLSTRRGEDVSSHELGDDEALLGVLATTFGLHFAPGTRFSTPGKTSPVLQQ
jgi:N-hydroxyarylamine O-acetyltransferase